MSPHARRAYVVIVNYRRWRDTLECLESVLRSDHADFRIVVCENGSGDDSWPRLLEWAEGSLEPRAESEALARLSRPPMAKPIAHVVLDEADVGRSLPAPVPVTFLRSAANRGFAGGNNLCLRHALGDPEAGWFWLLNNDTAVEPDALARLVGHMEAHPEIGMCGSTVAFYHRPDTIQAKGGGRYDTLLGTVRHLGEGEPIAARHRGAAARPDYVLGASLMASVAFVKAVGLLSEDYFLYFEELDWAARAAGRFGVGHAPDSIVYHKEGAASGSVRARPGDRPQFADYCGIRSRLLFTRRFHPWALPTVCLGLVGAFVNRALRGQWGRTLGILRLMACMGGGRSRLPAWMSRGR